jgi:hypothetical protein
MFRRERRAPRLARLAASVALASSRLCLPSAISAIPPMRFDGFSKLSSEANWTHPRASRNDLTVPPEPWMRSPDRPHR